MSKIKYMMYAGMFSMLMPIGIAQAHDRDTSCFSQKIEGNVVRLCSTNSGGYEVSIRSFDEDHRHHERNYAWNETKYRHVAYHTPVYYHPPVIVYRYVAPPGHSKYHEQKHRKYKHHHRH